MLASSIPTLGDPCNLYVNQVAATKHEMKIITLTVVFIVPHIIVSLLDSIILFVSDFFLSEVPFVQLDFSIHQSNTL
jgi:hypothetical protein